MAEESKRKSKTGAPRTEVFAMRLDPKLKYLAEIASRKQRRSLANFMEWAIELALKNTELRDYQDSLSVWDKNGCLWDVDEADRLANLAFEEPDLMTYDEQILWKLISETGHLWKGRHDSQGDWEWAVKETTLVRERLRENWEKLKQVANGDADKSILPTTSKKLSTTSGFDDFDDDNVPF